jgi:hypothetical protein
VSALELGPLLGLDSFVACVLLSAFRLSGRGRYCLAAVFGLCDGSATLLSQMPNASLLALSILAICFLLLLVPGSPGALSRRLLITLPLALSIDNLLDAVPPSAALANGIGSAAWALLGLQVGSMVGVKRWFNN